MDPGMAASTTGVLPLPVVPPSRALLLHTFTHTPMEGTCSRAVQACLPLLGIGTCTGYHYAAWVALQRLMSHPQGTQGSPYSIGQATAAPQSLFPLDLLPAAQEASLFQFPLSSPRTGLSDTTHVRGLSALPVTHWVPRAASTAQGMSPHMCAQTLTRVHRHGGHCTLTAHA